jgi:transaldolase/glucose-6-phosphate isomerase
MIKVPASTEGLPAMRELTSEGINVNITLLFGIDRYEAVARAYIEGLSAFVGNGGDPARLAYQRYLALCRTAEWQRLAAKGAHPQRLLWASTSTKNPRYRDVRYVEELIGRDTINTITPATLDAFRDHGRLRATLENDIDDARARLAALERVGMSLSDVTDKLLEDGVALFCKAFDNLLAAVDEGRGQAT